MSLRVRFLSSDLKDEPQTPSRFVVFQFQQQERQRQQKQQQRQRQQQRSSLPLAIRVLTDAADKLRPLGNHPALHALLRRTAREWARRWAELPAGTAGAAGAPLSSSARARLIQNPENTLHHEEHVPYASATLVSKSREGILYLENAAACLAEARAVLSTLAAAAESTGDVLASSPATAALHKEPLEEDDEGAAAADNNKSGKGKGAAKGKKTAAGAGDKTKKGASSSPSGELPDLPSEKDLEPTSTAAVSTPLGRCLTMVQLEEACVRMMLARVKGEGRSSKEAKEAAAKEEGVTPVQRYGKVRVRGRVGARRWSRAIRV